MIFFLKTTKLTTFLLTLIYLSGCGSLPSGAPFIKPQNNIPEGGLHARFFGTSTIFISDGHNSIMIDGFFTRRGFFSSFIHQMKSDEVIINTTLSEANIEDIDLVLVSHSHYDHALDSAYVADTKKATLMGSSTTLSISPTANKKLIDVNKKETVGDFEVTFYETNHGYKSSLIHFFESTILWATGGNRFKNHAEVYTFSIKHPQANILIIPSSDFTAINNKPIEVNSDIVFLGVGLLSNKSEDEIADYWQKAVINTKAKWVIPIHWDDFSRPLRKDLVSPSILIDSVDRTICILNKLSDNSEVKPIILLPPKKAPFSLSAITPVLTRNGNSCK
jgi:L-ascorbate metabolism protein UlaG (beta-lactamase superfamily)